MSDLPERDPLADLVARSIGARVEAVAVEELDAPEGFERRRLRYETSAGTRTAIFVRAPKGVTLEAQLLPFLARKSEHVPRVFSRGLPPPHAALGPWILMEDVLDAALACDGDPADVIVAKIAIERSVAHDLPALRALGVPERRREGGLATAHVALVHGALVRASARRTERGVVIVDWSRACIGPAVLDAAALIADLRGLGDERGAARARAAFVHERDDPRSEAELVATEQKSRSGTIGIRAGRTVAAAKAVEESPDSTGQGSG